MTASVHEMKLSSSAALATIRRLSADSLNVVFVRHATTKMKARRIDRSQVFACLKLGAITEGPFRSLTSNLWRVRMERFAAGEEICIAVEITEGLDGLLIITVFG